MQDTSEKKNNYFVSEVPTIYIYIKKYKYHFSFSERCKACLVLEVNETSGHGYQTHTAEDEGTRVEQEMQRNISKDQPLFVSCVDIR